MNIGVFNFGRMMYRKLHQAHNESELVAFFDVTQLVAALKSKGIEPSGKSQPTADNKKVGPFLYT